MSQPAALRRQAASSRRVARPGHGRGPNRGLVRGATPVEFVKLSPASNTTVLVTSRHPAAHYRSIADRLLRAEHVHAEQVGFILPPSSPRAQARLHMAGGEFCANAAMSLAALQAARRARSGPLELLIEASGAAQLLGCRVEPAGAAYRCQLKMPWPLRIDPYPFPGVAGAGLVRYADAVHLVAECDGSDPQLRGHAQQLALDLGASEAVSVVGIMLYDPDRGQLAPLVSVPALGSLIWEGSCGSGSAALGAYLATKAGAPVNASVKQPGGTVQVHADGSRAKATALRISTEVSIVAEGTAYIHD
ncbi:diaminopimelate epimerase [Arthrobacter sp. JUb115]|uniref:diaminopimelate epimerase n=1 Tax=Arthrobacter sp. JUb115 TaxID=2485108 RepID=UPI001061750A|nr:diaminopimelate epimerase [Arthrobacter sp. JUb115]TDU30116.1 diaminopimelate epimerase [Arthrobacter sp. JUb115]